MRISQDGTLLLKVSILAISLFAAPLGAKEYQDPDPEVSCKFLGQEIGTFSILRDAGYSESAAIGWTIENTSKFKSLNQNSRLAADIKTAMVAVADMVYKKTRGLL